MEKSDFFQILCTFTPEELNEFISSKGKIKKVDIIRYNPKQEKEPDQSNKNEQIQNEKRKE